jgi:hypothetical protein
MHLHEGMIRGRDPSSVSDHREHMRRALVYFFFVFIVALILIPILIAVPTLVRCTASG